MHEYLSAMALGERQGTRGWHAPSTGVDASEAGSARQSHGEALWGMTTTAFGGDVARLASGR